MFSSSVQPAIVSLFSSTGSVPLSLFASRTDGSLPSDSFVCLLNDSTSQPAPEPPRALITPSIEDEDNSPNYTLDQTVLHIQSPTLQTTYIRCPPQRRASVTSRGNAGGHLGLKHPWVHLQVRNLGREWALEVGVVDLSGREGVVRCATFQVRVPPCILTRTTQSCLRLHPEACRASSRTVRGVGVLDLTIARRVFACWVAKSVLCFRRYGLHAVLVHAPTDTDPIYTERPKVDAGEPAIVASASHVPTSIISTTDLVVHHLAESPYPAPSFLLRRARSQRWRR